MEVFDNDRVRKAEWEECGTVMALRSAGHGREGLEATGHKSA